MAPMRLDARIARQREKKEFVPVTLCIAAKCRNEVIGIVDTRITGNDMVANNHRMSKMARFGHENIAILAAGNIPKCMGILEKAVADFYSQENRSISCAADCYAKARDMHCHMMQHEINVIIAGVDSSGVRIYLVASEGMADDWTSTACVFAGTGESFGRLLYTGHDPDCSRKETLARAYLAKQAVASRMPDVSNETDIVIIGPDGYSEHSDGGVLVDSLRSMHEAVGEAIEKIIEEWVNGK
jgi:20S proteasome alpha/beta subunit